MHRYGCLAFQAWSHIPVGVHWAVMPRIWCSACFGIVRVTLDKGHRDSITWTGAFCIQLSGFMGSHGCFPCLQKAYCSFYDFNAPFTALYRIHVRPFIHPHIVTGTATGVRIQRHSPTTDNHASEIFLPSGITTRTQGQILRHRSFIGSSKHQHISVFSSYIT